MDHTGILFSKELLGYHLGEDHPMNTNRIKSAWLLFQEFGYKNSTVYSPSPASDEEIELVHSKSYIDEVKKLSKDIISNPNIKNEKLGLGTEDCPVFKGMWDTSLLVAGSVITSIDLILSGEISNAAILMAGLHHAQKSFASGFCYFNDMSIGIQKLRNLGYRVAYIDTDLHHGDGVQQIHYDDPDVLTISIHESGKYLYPGGGFSNEIGGRNAKGTSINYPLFPYTYDETFQTIFKNIVPPVIESFDPDFIIWQGGVDGHKFELLGHLMLTANTFYLMGKTIKSLADHYCDGNLIFAGGGGYNPRSNSRMWYTEFCAIKGIKLPEKTPSQWKYDYKQRFRRIPPESMIEIETTVHDLERPQYVKRGNEAYKIDFLKNLDRYYTFPSF